MHEMNKERTKTAYFSRPGILGIKSMMMLKVNHMLARPNQEKNRENALYYTIILISPPLTKATEVEENSP